MITLVMGASGSGKSTIGALLAERTGWRMLEADDYHSAANIAKMRAGVPLDEDDRRPWLAAVADEISKARCSGIELIVACSALRRGYRDTLLGGRRDDVVLVYLLVAEDVIRRRMEQRTHFASPSLLASQLATLETPTEDEAPLTLDATRGPDELVECILRTLHGEETLPSPPVL